MIQYLRACLGGAVSSVFSVVGVFGDLWSHINEVNDRRNGYRDDVVVGCDTWGRYWSEESRFTIVSHIRHKGGDSLVK